MQPKDFKQAKELKHPKQGRDTSYVSLHQIPTKDLHFSTMRHLNNPTFPFSSISTLRYLHIPTFGRQVIRGKHFHSSVIKANRVGRVISATGHLRGCPCKNRPLDFRSETEFLQIFRVRQLVHVINKNGNNLAFNAIFQYFWRQFQRTIQNRLNGTVLFRVKFRRCAEGAEKLSFHSNTIKLTDHFISCFVF